MGLLQGHRRSRSAHADRGNRYYPTFRLLERDGVDDAPTRYEPETLSARKPPADPYEAWRAQREAERERDRTQVEAVRWVQRHRGTAAAPTKGAAAAEAVRWVNRYRGVGATPTGRQEAPGGRVAGRPGGRERPADLVGAQEV
jgi:hypothetical protein